MNKSFNTQCNLTKFSTLIVNEYYHRCLEFTQFTADYCAKSVMLRYYIINHGVIKLMISG